MGLFRPTHLAAAALCLALAPQHAAAIEVDNLEHLQDHFGRYAPGGDCKRQPQIVIDRAGVAFESGATTEKAPLIDHAVSFGGNYYEGISTWLMPVYGDERPFLITLNANEKPGELHVDPQDRGWQGGPPLAPLHKALVDGSPYRRCK